MVSADSYRSSFNEMYGRLIAAVEDGSVPASTIREWERDALNFVDQSYGDSGSAISRSPEYSQADDQAKIELSSVNALRVRRYRGAGDAAISRNELADRLAALKAKYERCEQLAPPEISQVSAMFGDGMYSEELAFIAREQRAMRQTSFKPIGCLLIVGLIVIIAVMVF